MHNTDRTSKTSITSIATIGCHDVEANRNIIDTLRANNFLEL